MPTRVKFGPRSPYVAEYDEDFLPTLDGSRSIL